MPFAFLPESAFAFSGILTWEQVQVIRTLIERIVYNGKTKTFTARFRSAGIREMCQCGAKGKCK